MAELFKFIQARLAPASDGAAEETLLAQEHTPPPRDDAPHFIQHPHITTMQQWLDLNA